MPPWTDRAGGPFAASCSPPSPAETGATPQRYFAAEFPPGRLAGSSFAAKAEEEEEKCKYKQTINLPACLPTTVH